MKNNCQDCGCKDTFLPVAPCSDPAECPTPSKCEETFDSSCVTYTGLDLKCGDDTLVTTNTTIEQALENIVNKICGVTSDAFDITFNAFDYNQISATTNGGIPPFQYKWSIQQGVFNGHTISGNDFDPTVYLNDIPGNSLQVGGISGVTGIVYISHIRLDMTDAMSNKVTRYYTYAKKV